jgi:tyrosine-protein phosphatase SIW14
MTETSDNLSPRDSRPGRNLRRVVIVLVIALVAAGAYGWRCYLDTYHLATVQPRALYRDGNQSPCQFETAVRKVQPKTVVSLIDDGELAHPEKPQFQAEEQYLARKGIRLERIPVKLGGWPTKEDVEKFNRLASDPNNQPVLVHCAQGVRRTGMMVAAYQMKHMAYDKEKAKQEMLAFGHSDRTVNDVKRFIDGYDPATGKVPDNLMPSNE